MCRYLLFVGLGIVFGHAPAWAGMTLSPLASPEVVVAEVMKVTDKGATRGDPPRVQVYVRQVLRGRVEIGLLDAIWSPADPGIDTAEREEQLKRWAATPMAGPKVGGRFILFGRREQTAEQGLLNTRVRLRLSEESLATALNMVRSQWKHSLAGRKAVRLSALYDIGWQGPKASAMVPALAKLIETDAEPSVRCAALHALSTMGPKSSRAAPVVIEALLKDKAPEVRGGAATALGFMAPSAPRAIPSLIRALEDKTICGPHGDGEVTIGPPTVSSEAAIALGRFKAVEAVPALVKLLESKTVWTAQAAASALGEIGPPAKAGVPALIKHLNSPDILLRRSATMALEKLGPAAAEAVPILVKMLSDRVEWRWLQAAYALGSIGKAAEPAIPSLMAGLDDPKKWLHYAHALAGIGAPVVRLLIKDLQKGNSQSRRRAARVIWMMGKDGAAAAVALGRAMEDPEPKTRVVVANTLARLGPKARPAADALTKALRDDDKWIRHYALSALADIDPRNRAVLPVLLNLLKDEQMLHFAAEKLRRMGPLAKDAAPELAKHLAAKDKYTRLHVASCLWSIRQQTDKAEAVLAEGLRDPDREIRSGAASMIGRIGPPAKTMVPKLIDALKDKDVRLRAAEALGNIGPAAESAVTEIVPLLEVKGQVRMFAARALGRIGPAASAAIPALRNAACVDDIKARKVAREALKSIGEPDGRRDFGGTLGSELE